MEDGEGELRAVGAGEGVADPGGGLDGVDAGPGGAGHLQGESRAIEAAGPMERFAVGALDACGEFQRRPVGRERGEGGGGDDGIRDPEGGSGPSQADGGAAAVFVVHDVDGVGLVGLQVHLGLSAAVDQGFPVEPEFDEIIGVRLEHEGARRRDAEGAGPVACEVVGRDAGRGAAAAPVEIHLRIDAPRDGFLSLVGGVERAEEAAEEGGRGGGAAKTEGGGARGGDVEVDGRRARGVVDELVHERHERAAGDEGSGGGFGREGDLEDHAVAKAFLGQERRAVGEPRADAGKGARLAGRPPALEGRAVEVGTFGEPLQRGVGAAGEIERREGCLGGAHGGRDRGGRIGLAGGPGEGVGGGLDEGRLELGEGERRDAAGRAGPGVEELLVRAGAVEQEQPAALFDVGGEVRRDGVGEARHVGEHDGGVVVEEAVRGKGVCGEENGVDEKSRGFFVLRGVVGRLRGGRGIVRTGEGPGVGTKREGRVGAGTLEGGDVGPAIHDQHAKAVEHVEDADGAVVVGQIVAGVEDGFHELGAMPFRRDGERERPRGAGLDLSDGAMDGGLAIDDEGEGLRGDGFRARVGDGDVDAHGAVGADDGAGGGDRGDGGVADCGGEGEAPPDDGGLCGEALEGGAEGGPRFGVGGLPADALGVADHDDLLCAVVALREGGRGQGEGVGHAEGAEGGAGVVEGAKHLLAVGGGDGKVGGGDGAANDQGEGGAARGGPDDLMGVVDRLLEEGLAVAFHVHRGGPVDDEGDVALGGAAKAAPAHAVLRQEGETGGGGEEEGGGEEAAAPFGTRREGDGGGQEDRSQKSGREGERPGRAGARREEGTGEGQGGKGDGEAAHDEQEHVLEEDVAVAVRQRIAQEDHGAPGHAAGAPALEEVDRDRNRDRGEARQLDAMKEEHRSVSLENPERGHHRAEPRRRAR